MCASSQRAIGLVSSMTRANAQYFGRAFTHRIGKRCRQARVGCFATRTRDFPPSYRYKRRADIVQSARSFPRRVLFSNSGHLSGLIHRPSAARPSPSFDFRSSVLLVFLRLCDNESLALCNDFCTFSWPMCRKKSLTLAFARDAG